MSTDIRTLDAATLAHLQSWIGRTETLSDDITAAPVRGLSATLDRDDAPPVPGTALPPLWHWLYFLPQHRQSEIGPDGHAKRGGFLPPVPLPRRMWAGRPAALAAGEPAGGGRRGAAHLAHRVGHAQGGPHRRPAVRAGASTRSTTRKGLALTEEHDIVYRAAAQPGDPVPPPGAAPRRARPGSARSCPTTCCCSATRR